MPDWRLEALLAALTERVETLEQEVDRLREWRHDLPSDLITPIQRELQGMRELLERTATRTGRAIDPKKHFVTFRDVTLVSAAVTITTAVLKLFFKF